MLVIKNIEVVYNKVILVLRGVTIEVPDGQIVSLLGSNGAGKSTTLNAISGLIKTELGEIVRGTIEFDGKVLNDLKPEQIARMGIIQVQEGRRLFDHLTTEENLRAGSYIIKDRKKARRDLDMVYSFFPRLNDLRNMVSGYLSGGERQMLVIGRALISNPKVIMLDEPSLGLSPKLVKEIFEIIKMVNEEQKITILVVEQNANVALSISNYGYVMETGRVVLDGPSDRLRENEDIKEFYLGLGQLGERTSYRDVKHYKRRKRWLG
ncbi:ABC transporter ATP-binding protein [bacterium]|nr:ABC transporter ATP-binding protein [bacterium]